MIDESKIKQLVIPVPGNNGSVKYCDNRIEYDGHMCPYVELEGGIAKSHLAYEQMKNDLTICLELINYLKESYKAEPIISNALWESILVKYGRCFVSASEGRGIKLEKSVVFLSAPSDIISMHKHFMDDRHNFAAHSGSSNSDNVSTRLALLPKEIGKGLLQIYCSRDFVTAPIDSTLTEVQDLINFVINYIDDKLDKLYTQLKTEYASKDINELYEKSKTIIA